ncbi:MAG: hypothetical protein AB1646_11270 [Thermodesulfobacteriota bacterium]
MAEWRNSKSPEELGEAVGAKIEELFGGLFGDEEPPPPPESAGSATVQARGPAPFAVPRPAEPPAKPAAAPSRRPIELAPPPRSGLHGEAKGPRNPLVALIDHIEADVLNLEWEIEDQTIRGLLKKCKDLQAQFPRQGQGRPILDMTNRLLALYLNPDTTPPASAIKFLQDSVLALKRLVATGRSTLPDEGMMAALTRDYKEILEAVKEIAATRSMAASRPDLQAATDLYSSLLKKMSTAVQSLEEVAQRLARILAAWKQGKGMTPEDITRRLGTLSSLLVERSSELSAIRSDLAHINPAAVSATAAPQAGKSGPDGLFLITWQGTSLAIPTSHMVALYPLTKNNAQPLIGKSVITIGNQDLQRLPMKAVQPPERPVIPTWLIHLKFVKKDFFVLADKAQGYRSAPEGMDVGAQNRMKIGSTVYVVLNESSFRSG